MTSPCTEDRADTRGISVGRLILRFLAAALGTFSTLYVIAGRLNWIGGILFCAIYFSFLGLMLTWSLCCAPDLLQERSHRAANVKAWDRRLLRLYAVFLLATLVVGALDGGRFRWSRVPRPMVWCAAAGLAAAFAWTWWAASVNRYLSRWARIQDDRGQKVVMVGPYRLVRHPMYAAFLPGAVCLAATLESWYALAPAAVVALLFVVRTALEDRMLMDELPGYREYAARVRYRLVPGVW